METERHIAERLMAYQRIREEIKMHLETNENENTTHHNCGAQQRLC
jgi:hypothetical protein